MDASVGNAAVVAASVAATGAAPSRQHIEIVGERRRAHDAAFRSRVVSESLVPGARIQELARRHGICTSLIYRWRKLASPQAGAAAAVRLVPVRLAAPKPPETRAEPRRAGMIEIELTSGARVRVDGEVSLTALRRVLAALRG